MKKALLAMFALFALTVGAIAYAEDLPDIQGDEATVNLPPLTDPADATTE